MVNKSDMILWGDLKVYPRCVEEILFSQTKIFEACVKGVPDAYSGERIKAFVVLKPGLEATADEIRTYCKDNLVKHKV